MLIFLHSCLIGFIIAAPLGPIGALCIRKTLEMGIKGTLAVGLGAAFADTVYGAMALLGLAALTSFVVHKIFYFKLMGGIFLIFLGIKEYRARQLTKKQITLTTEAFITLIIVTFFITLMNPLTVLVFIGIFATFDGVFSSENAFAVISGIFAGSMIWWILLGNIVHHTKKLLSEKYIRNIRKASAVIILLFGCYALLSLLD